MNKTMMANLVAALIFASVLVGVTVAQEKSWATLTLKNNSQFEVELYVSDNYKCTAKAGKSCTAQVSAGLNHKLSARVDGEQVTSQQYTFQEDEVRTWTVGFRPN